MTLECPPDVAAMMRAAARHPMVPARDRHDGARALAHDAGRIDRLLPHRGSFRFIDDVVYLNRETATIVCTYDLDRSVRIFEDHFPERPTWPGVLQVEAIGQAGLCAVRLMREGADAATEVAFALTQVLGAEFARPVTPGGRLEIVARVVPDGLFNIIVGQCIQHDAVCCVAAVRGISEE